MFCYKKIKLKLKVLFYVHDINTMEHMKPTFKILVLLFISLFAVQGCQDNDVIISLEVQDFVWKG
jgi:hypothetical protein